MKALDFVKSLKSLPACLQVEPQPSGGWLSQCPSCAPCPSAGLSLAINQIGEDLVVRCYGGCDDLALVDGLYLPGDGMEVLTANQWLDREVKRGHCYDYLRNQLKKALPLPEALRPPAALIPPRALTFDELLALKVAPRAELCGTWLKEGTLAEVYGWRGAGKSWFGLNLAYCVASGVDFMRWKVPEARGVLYVDGEMGLDDIQSRLPLLHKSESKRAGRLLHPKLRYLADSNQEQFPDGLPKLNTKEGKALVESNLEGISLVVLDNLSTLYNSGLENDAESWVEVQDWMVSLRRRGLSVVFVHHSGKGGQQRGTSKREDVVQIVINLKQPDNHKAEDGCSFTLTFEKNRGVHGPSVASFSAKLTTDEDGDLVWALGTKAADQAAEWQAMHAAGMTTREIAKTFGVHHSTVARVLVKTTPLSQGLSQGVLSRVAPPYREGVRQSDITVPRDATSHATSLRQEKQNPHSERLSQPTERDKPCDKPATSLSHPHSGLSQPLRQEMRQAPVTLPRNEKQTSQGETGTLPRSYFNGVGTPVSASRST